jgi:hypothetical protein
MSCEMMFEGVRYFSFSRQYKVAIVSNTPLEFDPNVLVMCHEEIKLATEAEDDKEEALE